MDKCRFLPLQDYVWNYLDLFIVVMGAMDQWVRDLSTSWLASIHGHLGSRAGGENEFTSLPEALYRGPTCLFLIVLKSS